MATSKPAAKGSKEKFDFEFFGPVGVSVIMVGLIIMVFLLSIVCTKNACPDLALSAIPTAEQAWKETVTAAPVYLGWFLFQVLLYFIVPGPYVKGVPLKDGSRLEYKINAHRIFWISIASAMAADYLGFIRLSWVHDHLMGLALFSILFAVSLSIYLYVFSFVSGQPLSDLGNSGVMVYDFWMGRPKNPRNGEFDWKYFCELRPGLIGWTLINICMAYKQLELQGHVDNSTILVTIFHMIYVWDGLFNEEKLLTTADITTEGFGFMLAFGDLAWVPFTYTMQTRYLVLHPRTLTNLELLVIVATYLLGMYIFRASNSQKDAFRTNPKDPKVAHLQTMDTKRGTKLIISGWWGTARHINYFGDWLLGFAYCLPCGFSSIVPYFYAIYFAILLIHRERRDDHACRKKYGEDWEKYCRIVKWRIIPYIY